jgi:5-formyltetrahydrofolate cyclo-ligase
MNADMSENRTEAKMALRERMRLRRETISATKQAAMSEQICLHVANLEVFKRAQSIHAFWPLLDNREVDLRPLLRMANASGKHVWLPIVKGESLLHAAYTSDADLHTGPFGVKEPPANRAVSEIRPDLVLIPAMATDSTGARLGYGGGYYDRFLADMMGGGHCPPMVAAAFSFQVVESVPVSDHDVTMDATVTELGIRWHNSRQDWV